MIRFTVLCTILMSVSACNGTNPFMVDEATSTSTQSGTAAEEDTTTSAPTVTETTTNTGDPISADRTILPGTTNPSPNSAIFRREAQTGETGNGFAEGFAYSSVDDAFTVDNIAFDGTGPYTPAEDGSGNLLDFGPFKVFESEATAVDSLTSANINQLTYRALYHVSADGNTSVAIVRTGGYIEYGFGGYMYQRSGGVTLPTSGQAKYSGTDNYVGLRDFVGQGGLEYVIGDIEVNIDFNDFNAGSGVKSTVSNRRVFDLENNDVTSIILNAQGSTELPTLVFDIERGVLDSNGELSGTIQSSFGGEVFEEGSYYAILSGDNAETITGIIVVTGDDPRNSNVTFRETAGFFAVRQ